MSSTALTPLRNRLETSSTGALRKSSIWHYSQVRFSLPDASGDEEFGHHFFVPTPRQKSDLRYWLGMQFLGTSAALELTETQIRRLACHILVQRLDDAGLPEALETLESLVAFYSRPIQV